MINILLILIIISFIVDYSGIIDVISEKIYKLFSNVKYTSQRIPLIGCSLCTSFWVILFYMLYNDNTLIFSLFIASISGYMVQFITQLFYIIQNIINKLFSNKYLR